MCKVYCKAFSYKTQFKAVSYKTQCSERSPAGTADLSRGKHYGKDCNLRVEAQRPNEKSCKLEWTYKGWEDEKEDISSS